MACRISVNRLGKGGPPDGPLALYEADTAMKALALRGRQQRTPRPGRAGGVRSAGGDLGSSASERWSAGCCSARSRRSQIPMRLLLGYSAGFSSLDTDPTTRRS